MEVGTEFRIRIDSWDMLSRWEQSELGKDLRRLGLSYGEIMELIPVKKSTLATWCREVRLSEEQHSAIKDRTGSQEGIPRNTQRKRHRDIELIKAQARMDAEHLLGNPLWLAGTVLYWGEGFKTQSQLGLANADPHALRLFIRWADAYHVPATGFRARIILHADNDEVMARRFWSDQLDIPLTDFIKTFVKPDGTGHTKNHLAHGVCTVTMRRSADAFHTTLAWIDFVQSRLGS